MDFLYRPFIYEAPPFDYHLYSSHGLNTGVSLRYLKLFPLIFFQLIAISWEAFKDSTLRECSQGSNCFPFFPFPPKHLFSGQMHQPHLAQAWRCVLRSILSMVDTVLCHLDPSSFPQLLVMQPRDSCQLSALSKNCSWKELLRLRSCVFPGGNLHPMNIMGKYKHIAALL